MLYRYTVFTYWKHRRYLKYTKHNEKRILIRLGKIVFMLMMLILGHAIAMIYLEDMNFSDALWLSMTTVTTVGYGDISAASWQGRLATAIFLYAFAISLLAQLAGEFFDYRLLSREKKIRGQWRWEDMKDHILIINTPNENTENYLFQLIDQIRKSPKLEGLPIQILTRKFPQGLPDSITSMGVVYYSGVAENSENLMAVNVNQAKYILLITRDPNDPISDSLTFDVLNRIKEIATKATLIVEVAQDVNRQRMKTFGADVVIRPVRAYPELLVRAIVAPGTEEVLENLFTHDGDHMTRFDLPFQDKVWSDIVSSLVKAGAGIPMAYVDAEGVHCNPLPDARCTGSGIISLVNANQDISLEQVAKCLA